MAFVPPSAASLPHWLAATAAFMPLLEPYPMYSSRYNELEPEILLDLDVRRAEQQFAASQQPNIGAFFYSKKMRKPTYYLKLSPEFWTRLGLAGHGTVNISVIGCLLMHVDKARSIEEPNPREITSPSAGSYVARLKRVGCRVRLTHQQIADKSGVDRSTAARTINALRGDADMIVNWGKGWFEFCASLVWNGTEALRHAFLARQRWHKSKALVVTG